MQIYEARQRQGDLRFDYTVAHGGGIFPTGYCLGTRGQHNDAAHASKYHDDGHASAEEADACYRRFEVDHARYGEDPNTQRKCASCGTWTTGLAFLGGGAMRNYPLCPAHQNVEALAAVHTR